LDSHSVYLFGPTPGELVECLYNREAGASDPSSCGSVMAKINLPLGKLRKIILMSDVVTCGFCRELCVVIHHKGESEYAEVRFERIGVFIVVHGVSFLS
jgi:hypothetical protein